MIKEFKDIDWRDGDYHFIVQFLANHYFKQIPYQAIWTWDEYSFSDRGRYAFINWVLKEFGPMSFSEEKIEFPLMDDNMPLIWKTNG